MEEMTYGEKAMGVNFNPGGDKDVEEIKKMYAELADKIQEFRGKKESVSGCQRMFSIAMNELQSSQMRAVKGKTRQYD